MQPEREFSWLASRQRLIRTGVGSLFFEIIELVSKQFFDTKTYRGRDLLIISHKRFEIWCRVPVGENKTTFRRDAVMERVSGSRFISSLSAWPASKMADWNASFNCICISFELDVNWEIALIYLIDLRLIYIASELRVVTAWGLRDAALS